MKKILLASAAFIALAAPAAAADLAARPYTKAPAMAAAPIYNWTAFYIGGHVGGGFPGENNLVGGSNDGTFMGGAQVGYDMQFSPNWPILASPMASRVMAAVMVTPSAAVWNICSPRTGPARSNISTMISAT